MKTTKLVSLFALFVLITIQFSCSKDDTEKAIAEKIVLLSGNNQTAYVGVALPNPIEVQVSDQFENPYMNGVVYFSVQEGSLSSESVITDEEGKATVTWTLGASQGEQTLTVEIFDTDGTTHLEGSPIQVKANATSPYASMHGAFSGDIAIQGDKNDAGTTTATVVVDGEYVTISFDYAGYPITFSADVTEVQTDKDILYQILEQDITVNGVQVTIIGYGLIADYPNVHGTFSDTNKTLTFSFTYTSATESMNFVFKGTKN
jgi:hypothetical protein